MLQQIFNISVSCRSKLNHYLRIMSREEATELIFGHQNSFDPNTVNANYQSIYSRIQGQITHAPDAELKKKFQSKLGQLEQAYALLTKQNPLNQELPSLQPIEIQEKLEEEDISGTDAKEKIPAQKSSKKPSFGEAIMNKWVFFTTLGSVVLGLGMTTLWLSAPSNEDIDSLNEKINIISSVLENKSFYIHNDLDHSIKILSYYVVYYNDETDQMDRYGPIEYTIDEAPTIPSKGKNRDPFIKKSSREYVFPGKVLFISLLYTNGDDDKPSSAQYFADYVGDHVVDGIIISPSDVK